jgi:VanZ family protein
MFYLSVAKLSSEEGKYLSGINAHFFALFFTAFLLVFMLKQVHFRYPYLVAIIYSAIAVVTIEYIQKSIPYRTFGYNDIFYGMLGAVTFIVFGKIAEWLLGRIKR